MGKLPLLQFINALVFPAAVNSSDSADGFHQGNPFCWDSGALDISFDSCCYGNGSGCWDDFYDYDACCLDPAEHYFVPSSCHDVVFEWLVVGGSIGWTNYSRSSMSQFLRQAGESQLQGIAWALPSLADADKQLEILDLGAGLAKADIALHRHFQGHARFVYVDRSEIDAAGMALVSAGLQKGYTQKHPFYGNLACARSIAALNGLRDVRTLELNSDSAGLHRIPSGSIDILVSLASWGFHYPISVHVRQVARILRKSGVLIVTLRGKRTFHGLGTLARAGFTCITGPAARSYNVTRCVLS